MDEVTERRTAHQRLDEIEARLDGFQEELTGLLELVRTSNVGQDEVNQQVVKALEVLRKAIQGKVNVDDEL